MKSRPLEDVMAHLSRLPGIGERSAMRLAFHLLRAHPQFRRALAQSIESLSEIILCSQCRTVTQSDPCAICASPVRKARELCVVEKASDIYSIERLGIFKGKYFVLHALLSPLEGVGPEDIGFPHLVKRVESLQPEELIMALSPTVEGDATTQFLAKRLSGMGFSVTRLASGLPIGGEIEYADQITLEKAFAARAPLFQNLRASSEVPL